MSEGISPVQGTDSPWSDRSPALRGEEWITSALGGTLLNQKFSPDAAQRPCSDLDRLVQSRALLLRARRSSHPVQRRDRCYLARGAGTPGASPRSNRSGGRVQRLLLRSDEGRCRTRSSRAPVVVVWRVDVRHLAGRLGRVGEARLAGRTCGTAFAAAATAARAARRDRRESRWCT